MKRIALIAAAFLSFVGIVAGSIVYFKPAFLFGVPKVETASDHGVPIYTSGASEEVQARRYALRLVEQLGAVQDRIIRGDRAALADQQRLLNEIAREVRKFSRDEWRDYVNVRTSLLYVLSGGDANVLTEIVKQESLAVADQWLARGIISFAEGHTKKARELFADIDPRLLDVSLVGPFALAKASVYIDDDHAKAVSLLDDARLACPHTAIEEASARREIPILLNIGDTTRAMMLTASYVREFGKSIYAWKLFRDFAEAAAKQESLDNATTIDLLVAGVDEKDMQPTSELLVDIAGEAVLQGRLKLAKAATGRVLATSRASPEAREKARLYAAAAEAPSDDAGNALKALDQITVDRLSEEDMEIREVAGFIAETVVGDATEAPRSSASAPDARRAQAPVNPPPGPGAIKATAALDKADAILKEADSIISGSGK